MFPKYYICAILIVSIKSFSSAIEAEDVFGPILTQEDFVTPNNKSQKKSNNLRALYGRAAGKPNVLEEEPLVHTARKEPISYEFGRRSRKEHGKRGGDGSSHGDKSGKTSKWGKVSHGGDGWHGLSMLEYF